MVSAGWNPRAVDHEERQRMPRSHPPEFRRKVLDLVKAGRPVQQVAADLDMPSQTIYVWLRQDHIDSGLEPGLTSADHAELIAARRRIAELETELAITRRAVDLLREAVPPRAIEVTAKEGLPIATCCRILQVSESGFHMWRRRPPSARALRHAWLTEQIRAVHADSRGAYGGRRVHADLTLGLGIQVGHGAVELLMRRAGLKGLPGVRRPRRKHQTPTAADLVDRDFHRSAPNQLLVTDITGTPPARARSTAAWCWTSTPAA
ncbi:hypothetical protein ETD83_25470 [Actinomadura soli]|uniref:HTH-like domain-containing protein n=1 Tax=Actinomadura soli TaxID=2508997 RepID=A0A5C4J6D2_9ACTN|nr:IS3 family transposase [Actinomadura soli]TMQ93463.1 hypothetical protein ETD83_25470 [Actinomadura soli]